MRGATLNKLLTDLRDELRRSNSPAVAPDDVGPLRRTLNHVYRVLYYDHDWPFLNTLFPSMTLNAGQRYYDFPTGLDPDRVIESKVKWSGDYVDITRGIEITDYNAYDPDDNERSSPALKWDVRFTGEREQIEIWPLPDGTDQRLRFFGTFRCDDLVNDTDICRLESELVVLYAAAELLSDEHPDKEAKRQLAQRLLALARVRGGSSSKPVKIGLGQADRQPIHPRALVRISS
jgi:hypothetical protein